MKLREILINTKEKYSQLVVKEFERFIKRHFNDIKNNILKYNWLQIYIPDMPHCVHFELMDLKVNTLCNGGTIWFVLHAEGECVDKAVELAVNDDFKNAVKELGFEFCYNYDTNPHQRTIIRKRIELDKGFKNQEDLLKIFNRAKQLFDYIRDDRIRKRNKELGAIRNYLLQKTLDVYIGEPWLGFDLFIIFNKNKSGEIGIESHFAIEGKKLVYQIMITTWKKENWSDQYQDALQREFKDSMLNLEYHSNRTWLHLRPIMDPDTQKIKDELEKVYIKLKKIVSTSSIN